MSEERLKAIVKMILHKDETDPHYGDELVARAKFCFESEIRKKMQEIINGTEIPQGES